MLDPSKVRQRPFHEVYPLSIGAGMPITVVVWLDGQAGILRVKFAPHGHTLAQEFPIEGRTYGVGGTRWHIRCPETKKLARELYWVEARANFVRGTGSNWFIGQGAPLPLTGTLRASAY
jgi:hypothetical protein